MVASVGLSGVPQSCVL